MIVVKVGGSLFDHPKLGPGLRDWLQQLSGSSVALIPGGGSAADVVRDYHRNHQLPEVVSHWVAIQAMDLNGSLLKHWVGDLAEVPSVSQFCRQDDSHALSLPHDWRVTSDSIAARFAEVNRASKLVLLKSTDRTEGISWDQAVQTGLVDNMFPEIVARSGISVELVNFRRRLD